MVGQLRSKGSAVGLEDLGAREKGPGTSMGSHTKAQNMKALGSLCFGPNPSIYLLSSSPKAGELSPL